MANYKYMYTSQVTLHVCILYIDIYVQVLLWLYRTIHFCRILLPLGCMLFIMLITCFIFVSFSFQQFLVCSCFILLKITFVYLRTFMQLLIICFDNYVLLSGLPLPGHLSSPVSASD